MPARPAGRLRRPAAGGRQGGPLGIPLKVFSAIALLAVANGALILLGVGVLVWTVNRLSAGRVETVRDEGLAGDDPAQRS